MTPSLEILTTIHAAFPFLEGFTRQNGKAAFPRSFRVHLAGMLNQYCAAFFEPGINRMAIAYSANTPRSGKSLLAKMGIIAVHGWPQAQTIPMTDRSRPDETELRKIIDAAVATGAPYLFFDNVRGFIESAALEAFLTVPVWTGRVFGSNTKTFRAENNCTLVMTGNDLNLGPDLRNRFLMCDLFVAEAEASERTVPNPIEDNWIYKNRQTLLDCLDALVVNWDSKGRPGMSGKVRPGFETWCHTIGGIIEAAGMGSLLETPKIEASGSKPEQHARSLAHYLASLLSPEYPEHEFKPADIVNICHRFDWFDWQIDGREESTRTTLDDLGNETGVEKEKPTIKLSAKSRSIFGLTIKSYAPAHIGRTWVLGPGKVVRLKSKGEEHAKRIVATLEFSARARLQSLMDQSNISVAHVETFLTNTSSSKLDELTPAELGFLADNFHLLVQT